MRLLLTGALALFFTTSAMAQDAEPPPPTDHAADRFYDPQAMAAARAEVHQTHGGDTFSMVLVNLAEVQAVRGKDGYRWEGEAWYGGDIHRLVVKTEGEGVFGGNADAAEAQALYSRAIGPYFNLQAGVRHDFAPGPARTYATVGVEGLAPYWLEVNAALFLSEKGDIQARVESYYDITVTQRLVLQPRVEINAAAQDVPERDIGAGISTLEAGLRLRYEVAREFAPYIGVSYEQKAGQTATFARLAGERVRSTSFVAGIRMWF
ncbi:MAG: copper resistance protein B [Rhodospirillaceae bacterium]